MSDHRRLGIIAGAVLLPFAVTGCSGLNRSAVGTISYTTPASQVVTVSNPSVRGCHPLLRGGAASVVNNTLIDMVLYPGTNCAGRPSVYNATTLTNTVTPPLVAWRSYSLVH
ncbi:hypothetical protein OG204_08115 [Streptomyces sp. NBC_01387]|uniref:hypothetical protein n=1 Tax=unclassified Streptomyces TaxID=2593676 RepID=UPI002024686E|nr:MULTISPECIES: hypothetical protein [unclassified Streptomyces]MCX4551750.1 hypothetical protein [Streptomyces sp. NBC_01500]WSC23120.1 hypothetical protein OIE60_27505 [Streptomyces sp. NBC_01766]WSV57031.1 hypothetical protein OG282_26930 [Streptomyces sp. NBC_01014]